MIHSFLSLLNRLAVLSLLVGSFGCQKQDEAVATPQTITDRILEDGQFGLFRVAIAHAGMSDALKAGNLTLFAPTDAAFQAAGLGTETAIKALSPEQVRRLVLYHLLAGPVLTSSVPAGLSPVETASQGVVYLNKTTDGTIYVNNARLTQADIKVANGYLHAIDRLLTPSTGNLLTTIQNNPNLTFLSAAVKRVATSTPTFLTILENASLAKGVTVFAPNDAAFRADKTYNTLASIESASVSSLTNLLLYHVVSGVMFSNQFQTGSLNTLLSGSKVITIATASQLMVKGDKNLTAAVVRQGDLPATNGVIHVIDQVLLP